MNGRVLQVGSTTILLTALLGLVVACSQVEEPPAINTQSAPPPTEVPERTASPPGLEPTLPAPTESSDRPALAYLNQAADYGEQGRWDLAIEELNQAIALDPQFAEAYYRRGSAYEWVGEHDKAIADLTQAVTLDPHLAEAYFVRGLAYEWTEGYEKAIAEFSQAVTLDPQFAEAYYQRGKAYVGTREHDKAIADLNQVIALAPQFAEAYYARGMAFMWTEAFEEAIADFSQAIALNPQSAEAHLMRSIAYNVFYGPEITPQDQAKMYADIERALELDPNLAEKIDDLYAQLQETFGPEGSATATPE